jgi:hypothetical protein
VARARVLAWRQERPLESHGREDNSSHGREDNSSHEREDNSSHEREDNSSHGREDDVDYSMPTRKIEPMISVGIIVYVEMAIKWNHISGVNSLSTPGQFMPFFIALAQLFATLYRLEKQATIKETTEDDGNEDGKFL